MEEIYYDLFDYLLKNGYESGDDISYFEFSELCEEIGISPDNIDLDTFSNHFKIYIG